MNPYYSTFIDIATHVGYAVAIGLLLTAARKQIRTIHDSYRSQRASRNQNAYLVISGAVGFTTLLTMSFISSIPFVINIAVAAAAAAVTPMLLSKRMRRKYQQAFDQGLIDGLTTIATALKAGITLPEALKICAHNSSPELSSELKIALKEYRLGVSIEDALNNLRNRVGTENANIAFGAMIISTQVGGRLSSMLTRIVQTIRERDKVSGKLRSLTAQGRMQAILVSAAPPLLIVMLFLWDPSKFQLLTETVPGQLMLGIACILEVLGISVMHRMMQLDI